MSNKKNTRRQMLQLMASTGMVGSISMYSEKVAAKQVESRNHGFYRFDTCDDSSSIDRPSSSSWPTKRYDAQKSGYNSDGGGPSGATPAEAWRVSLGTGKAHTPVIEGETAYVGKSYPDAGVTAINLESGTKVWQRRRDTLSDVPPVVKKGNIYIGYQHSTTKLGEGTQQKWRADSPAKQISEMTIVGGKVLVGTSARKPSVSAIEAKSGDSCWNVVFSGASREVTGLSVVEGLVYVGTLGRKSDHPDTGTVRTIDPVTGEIVWSVETNTPVLGVSGSSDTVFARTSSDVHAFDSTTGEPKWQRNTRGGSVATPVVGDGTVYFGGNFEVTAVDSESGDTEWRHEIQARNPSPIVVGKTVYFTTDSVGNRPAVVGALDKETGEKLWSEDVGERDLSSPAVADGKLVVSSQTAGKGIPGQESFEQRTAEIIAYK